MNRNWETDGWQEFILTICSTAIKHTSTHSGNSIPFSMEVRLRHHSGEYRWKHSNGTPRYSSKGKFIGYIGHCLDITEKKNTSQKIMDLLREKELILKEVHHRIKNNISTILSLLSIQADEQDNPATRIVLEFLPRDHS